MVSFGLLLLWFGLFYMLRQLIWPVDLNAEKDGRSALRLEDATLEGSDVQDSIVACAFIHEWDVHSCW